jgi:hypothetical protein
MKYQVKRYKDIEAFVLNNPITQKNQSYTIVDKCKGLRVVPNVEFTHDCFGCLFCILEKEDLFEKFIDYWGDNFIKDYCYSSFQGKYRELPNIKKKIITSNDLKNLEIFTSKNETRHIQPWAAGLLSHMSSVPNRTAMEVPIFNDVSDRNWRLDIGCIANNYLLAIEAKVSLDSALADERFVEQHYKYNQIIESLSIEYDYITLFGGKETDLYPPNNNYCTGQKGAKSERFYNIVISDNIKFISANALWYLFCRYLELGNKYAFDRFIKNIFSDKNCLGLLSAGKVMKNQNGDISIEVIPI